MKAKPRFLLTLVMVPLLLTTGHAQTGPDWSAVERTLGRAGKLQDGVYKVAFPRTDLRVRMGRTHVLPAAALGSWVAFRQDNAGAGVVADGDLVLLEPEVNGAISALVENGIEVSAVHNHLTGEQPQVLYVHFFARGDLEDDPHTVFGHFWAEGKADSVAKALREALNRLE